MSMINLFSPGDRPDPDAHLRDPMATQEAHYASLEGLTHEVPGGLESADDKRLFVAFAEVYYSASHLDSVALFYDHMEWMTLREDILIGDFPVPNIKTAQGLNEARNILREGQV